MWLNAMASVICDRNFRLRACSHPASSTVYLTCLSSPYMPDTLQYCHGTSFSAVSCCSKGNEWNHPLLSYRSCIQIWNIWKLSWQTLEEVPLGFLFDTTLYVALKIFPKAYENPGSLHSFLIYFHPYLVKLDLLVSAAGVGWRGCHIFQKTGTTLQQCCQCWSVTVSLPLSSGKQARCHTSCLSQHRGTHPSGHECWQCLCSPSSGSLCHVHQVTASPVSHLPLLLPVHLSSCKMLPLKSVISSCGLWVFLKDKGEKRCQNDPKLSVYCGFVTKQCSFLLWVQHSCDEAYWSRWSKCALLGLCSPLTHDFMIIQCDDVQSIHSWVLLSLLSYM